MHFMSWVHQVGFCVLMTAEWLMGQFWALLCFSLTLVNMKMLYNCVAFLNFAFLYYAHKWNQGKCVPKWIRDLFPILRTLCWRRALSFLKPSPHLPRIKLEAQNSMLLFNTETDSFKDHFIKWHFQCSESQYHFYSKVTRE